MVDPRLSFMARVAARWWLVENGKMGIDEAFDGFVNDILERKAIEKHFDVIWRAKRREELQRWRASRGPDSMLRVRSAETGITD